MLQAHHHQGCVGHRPQRGESLQAGSTHDGQHRDREAAPCEGAVLVTGHTTQAAAARLCNATGQP